jgi:hypothetical protein
VHCLLPTTVIIVMQHRRRTDTHVSHGSHLLPSLVPAAPFSRSSFSLSLLLLLIASIGAAGVHVSSSEINPGIAFHQENGELVIIVNIFAVFLLTRQQWCGEWGFVTFLRCCCCCSFVVT